MNNWRRFFCRVIHNAAALASVGPLRDAVDNVGDGISVPTE